MKKLLYLSLLLFPLFIIQGCNTTSDNEWEQQNPSYSFISFTIDQQDCIVVEIVKPILREHTVNNPFPYPTEVKVEGEWNLIYKMSFDCEDWDHRSLLPAEEEGYYFDLDMHLIPAGLERRWPFAPGTYFKDNYCDMSRQYTIPPYCTTKEIINIKTLTIEGKWSADFLDYKSGISKKVEGTWRLFYESLDGINIISTPME